MTAITCTSCRTVNQSGSIRCVQCGSPIVDTSAGSPPPGPPPPTEQLPLAEPSPPSAEVGWNPGAGPLPGRRRRSFVPLLVFALALLALAAFALLQLREDELALPDTFAGLPRMRTEEAVRSEQAARDASTDDLRLGSAWYGRDVRPELALVVMDPEGQVVVGSPGQFLRERGQTAAILDPDLSASMVIEPERVRELANDRARFACAPVALTAGIYAGAEGALCVWQGPDRAGMLVWAPADPPAGLLEAALRSAATAELSTS